MGFGEKDVGPAGRLALLLLLLIHGAAVRETAADPSSRLSQWFNRPFAAPTTPRNWNSFGPEDLTAEPALDSYQIAQTPRTRLFKAPGPRSLNLNVNFHYPSFDSFQAPSSPAIRQGGIPRQHPHSLRELRVPGLLENVEDSDGAFGGEAPVGGPFDSLASPRAPPLPDIQIGDPPPQNQFGPYRLQDNFQQSFQVLLMPQSTWATQNYRDVQGATFSDGIGSGGNEGSIITANRIYFTPITPYSRSRPFRKGRTLPPLRRPYTGLSQDSDAIALLQNISSVSMDRQIAAANADKTIAVVHLQSYSALPPNRHQVRNDSDILEAQNNYGFGGNNFYFGSTHTIVSVFKKLLNTNFEGLAGRGQDTEEVINRLQNFVNATQKIHFWAQGQGEEDARGLFKFTLRQSEEIDPTFIDTAPVTDTLSAVVF